MVKTNKKKFIFFLFFIVISSITFSNFVSAEVPIVKLGVPNVSLINSNSSDCWDNYCEVADLPRFSGNTTAEIKVVVDANPTGNTTQELLDFINTNRTGGDVAFGGNILLDNAELNSDGSLTSLYARNNPFQFKIDRTTDYFYWSQGTNHLMYLNGDGDLGIGTTSPTHKLNVVGDANITGTLYEADISGLLNNNRTGGWSLFDKIISSEFKGNGSQLEEIDIERDIVLWMPFQSGTQTKDHSGEGNDGTITGATYNVTGGYDGFGAYEFDGDGDYIATTADVIVNQSALSFSVWVKNNEQDGSSSQYIWGNGWSDYYSAKTYWITTNKAHFLVASETNGIKYIQSSSTLNQNQWYHIVGTYDGSELNLYVNGVSDATAVAQSGPIRNPTQIFTISEPNGADPYGNAFNGTIDEVLIFNRSLSAEEIKRLYKKRRIETGFLDDVTFGGDVGIGTTNPTHTLNVVGDANITGDAIIEGDMAAKNLPQEPFNAGDMYVCWDATDGSLFLNETGC
jgi:hypothetical protein